MTTETTTTLKPGQLYGTFTILALADSFSARTVKPSRIFLGEGEEILVVNMAGGERMLAAGFSEVR